MNCPICGSRIEPGAAYCTSCGARVDPAVQGTSPEPQAHEPEQQTPSFEQPSPGQTPPPPYTQQAYGQGAYPPPYGAPQPPVQPMFDPTVNPYYAREFANLAQTGKSRFNWAAFFLGPFQSLYRGHTKRFLTFFLPLMIAALAVSTWFSITLYKIMGASLFNPWFEPDEAQLLSLGASALVMMLVSLIGLVLYIVNGFTFNKSYYHLRMGDPHVPAHGGRVAILVVIWFVLVIGMGIFSSTYMVSAVGDSDWNAPYSEQDPGGSDEPIVGGDAVPVTAAGVDEVLSQYSFVTLDQSYYFGYNDPDASDDMAIVSSSMLFCSDDVTFDEALTAGCTSSWWETYTPEESVPDDGSHYYSFYGTLGQDEICFDAVAGGGNFVLLQGYVWNGTEYAAVSDEEMCALVAYLYACAGSQESALAYDVRGIWTAETGEALVIDGSQMNGQPYILWFISDDVLAVYLDGTTDVSGEFYMMFSDEQTLNVWQYDEAGNIVSDLYFTREE